MVKVKVDAYKVISEAVERGVRYGFHRMYKYNELERPDEGASVDVLYDAVINELCEVIKFD